MKGFNGNGLVDTVDEIVEFKVQLDALVDVVIEWFFVVRYKREIIQDTIKVVDGEWRWEICR